MKIGVSSARDRLNLYYREKGTLSISSEKGQGTTVTMRWPAQKM